MALEIRAYSGDGSDLARLIVDTWIAVYGGRAWFPVWDQAYVEWRLMDPRILDRELLVCAYDDDRLVGCMIAEQTELRVGTQRVQGSLTSYLSVDPKTHHRGLGARLLDRQRRLHQQRGLRLSLGVSNSHDGAESKKFWSSVARRWPQEFALLGGFTLWAAVIQGGAIAAAGLNAFEKLGPRASAILSWACLKSRGATVRPFRPDDLDSCLAWTHRQGESADCQMIWSRQRMSVQLDHPYARTWIAERDGRAWGFANGYLIDWSGRQQVRVGFIELCAADGGALAHASLLIAAGRALAAEGAQMVVVLDAGCQPRTALLAAGFMPMNPHVQKMALLGDLAGTLAPKTRLHCAFT